MLQLCTISDTIYSRSEMHIILTDNVLVDWERMGLARERGYILTVDNNIGSPKDLQIERMKRWYSMGCMYPADFDGDGEVELEDETMFLLSWDANTDFLHPERTLKVFATGDINQDGHVDLADRVAYTSYVDTVNSTDPLGVRVNYGAPNQP